MSPSSWMAPNCSSPGFDGPPGHDLPGLRRSEVELVRDVDPLSRPDPRGRSGRNMWVEVGTVGPDEPSRRLLVEPERRRAAIGTSPTLVARGHLPRPDGPGRRPGVPDLPIRHRRRPGRSDDGGRHRPGLPRRLDQRRLRAGRASGRAASGERRTLYQWTSGPLSSGVWQFAVLPFDKAGNVRGLGADPQRDDQRRAPSSGRRPTRAAPGLYLLGAAIPAGHAQLAGQPFSIIGVPGGNNIHDECAPSEAGHGGPELGRPGQRQRRLLDGMTAIGGLAVTPTEVPSATLNVRVSGGNYIKADGTIGSFAGRGLVRLARIDDLLSLADRRRGPDRGGLVPDHRPRAAGPRRRGRHLDPLGRRRARPVPDRRDGTRVRPEGRRHHLRPADRRHSRTGTPGPRGRRRESGRRLLRGDAGLAGRSLAALTDSSTGTRPARSPTSGPRSRRPRSTTISPAWRPRSTP